MPINNRYLMLLLVLSFGPLLVWADRAGAVSSALTKRQAQALEATANTPDDHLKLANYYREQARKLDEKVRYNEEMAAMYRQRAFPLDGKMGVPMQRLCKDWAEHFAAQEERVIALANFHAAKAGRAEAIANTLAQPDSFGLLRPGFTDTEGLRIHATPEQSSLFSNSIGSSNHFYDLTRISSYVLNAKGQPPVELVQLQNSAAALFDAQQRFFETLTETQRLALRSQLGAIQKLRQDVETRLSCLAAGTTSPASAAYLKTVRGLKRDLEGWNVKQQQIANRLGIR